MDTYHRVPAGSHEADLQGQARPLRGPPAPPMGPIVGQATGSQLMLALQGNVRMPPPLPVAVTDRVSPLRLQPNALLAGHVRGCRDECASGEESVPGADAATTGLPKASGVCAAAPTVRAWMRRRRRTASPLLQEERLIRHHRRDRRMGRGRCAAAGL